MDGSLTTIKKYYNACRPDEPIAPTDPRWVNLAPLRGSGRDIVSQILRQIELEENFVTFLVTGFRGTGKTTLLKDCQQQLIDSGYDVVYTDVEADYLLNPYETINVNDVLLTAAMALVDQGLGPGYLKRLWDDIKLHSQSQVALEGIEVETNGVTFKSTLERIPALRERLQAYARQRALYEQVRQLILSAQADTKSRKRQGLVLILDSLDHLSDPPEKQETEVTDSVLKVLRDASELRRLPLHLILTVPPTILPYAHDLRANYGEPFIVPEAKIFTREDKRDDTAFLTMEKFVDNRVPLTCFDNLDSVRSLIAASGGYLRDLIRLLRNCLAEVDVLPITSAIVRQVIDRSVSLSAELPLETYRADLKAILINPEHRLPRDDDKLRRMYQMIRDRVILRYSNHEQWEGIHPLVLAHINRELFEHLVFPPRT